MPSWGHLLLTTIAVYWGRIWKRGAEVWETHSIKVKGEQFFRNVNKFQVFSLVVAQFLATAVLKQRQLALLVCCIAYLASSYILMTKKDLTKVYNDDSHFWSWFVTLNGFCQPCCVLPFHFDLRHVLLKPMLVWDGTSKEEILLCSLYNFRHTFHFDCVMSCICFSIQ